MAEEPNERVLIELWLAATGNGGLVAVVAAVGVAAACVAVVVVAVPWTWFVCTRPLFGCQVESQQDLNQSAFCHVQYQRLQHKGDLLG